MVNLALNPLEDKNIGRNIRGHKEMKYRKKDLEIKGERERERNERNESKERMTSERERNKIDISLI